jgi:hypothetical protein
MDPAQSRARRCALIPAFPLAALAALALAAGLGAATANATPNRPETGLPYAPDATPAAPAMGVGSLHGPVGPLELGLLADLFVTSRLVSRQDSLFHEFELSRVQASAWAAYRSLAGVNLTVDTIRSSGSRSYFGVDGDAILPRLKWAFAEVTTWCHYLSLRAGLVPDLLLQYAEVSWGFRVQGPTGLERDAQYTPGDLGATVEAALPLQLGSVALQVGNGEGLALREQNNGKNLTAALRFAPLRSRAPDFLLHFLFRDGSLGAGSAADRRGSFGLTYAGTRLGAGALATLALGYRGLGDRTAAHLTAWLRGELPVGFALLARADVLWPDASLYDSLQVRAICGLAYSLPALVRLVASYEGTLPFGALVAQVPALTEHALLIQAEVRL